MQRPPPDLWTPRLKAFFGPFLDLLDVGVRASDTQRNAEAYLTGLLLPGERKSMEPMARRLPEATPDRFQQFITDSPWNPDLVQRRLIEVMAPQLAQPRGVLALDDTSFPKQGRASVGVARQWCGSLGKPSNCQVGVSLYYVLPDPHYNPDLVGFSLGTRLYLPHAWAEDLPRRAKVRVPPYVEFAEKWRIGLALVDRARELKVPHRAVTADADYGTRFEFRQSLRERNERYAVGIQLHSLKVMPLDGRGRDTRPGPIWVRDVARGLPPTAWRTLTWGQGTKGPLRVEVARVRVQVYRRSDRHDHSLLPTEEVAWLLFERRSNETKAYLIWGLDDLTLRGQTALVRHRWPIEQGYQHMKEELGLDHFEGRTWTGWHHHVTMVSLAHAFLMLQRKVGVPEGERRPSLPKVRKWFQGQVGLALARQSSRTDDTALRDRLLDRVFAITDMPISLRGGRWTMPTLRQFAREEA